jgi:integrase
MGVYHRDDSCWWWLALERPGQRPIREATRIPVDGGNPQQTKLNRELAQAAYSARMGDLARARYQIQIDRPISTFAAYRVWYLDNISVHKRNLARERSMFRQLGRMFDRLSLHQITRDQILEWRSARVREVAPGTVNRELELLKHLLGTAVPKYLEKNPATGVTRLRVPEREIAILSPAQEAALLRVATVEEQAIVICALDTLQRLSNVANLERAQDHRTYVTVLNPKVKGYKVPVSSRLRKALDVHARSLPKDERFYFPSIRGATDDATRKNVREMFMTLCVKAHIPAGRKSGGLSFHSLRHTGASRMLTVGKVDIKTVAEIGGWADIKVLQRYLHPTDTQRRAAVETIGARR